jgi:hypothetical protein
MIVGVKIDPKNYQQIKGFVEKGKYDSIENFVEIAVLNQILIENNEVSNFQLIKEQKALPKEYSSNKITQLKLQTVAQTQTATQQSIQYLSCPKGAPISVQPPLSLTEETANFPIWGQLNRLAPAKMVLRMLANQILLGADRIDLKRFSADAAEASTSIRLIIEKKDKKKRIRGTELYIALPKKDPNSQQRFINYYVGKLPSGKWTDGILTGLGLARIELLDDGSTVIGLTENGRTFGCLSSPLIDDFLLQGKQIEEPFSPAEVEFLLSQLETMRPGEMYFMKEVLRFIKEGVVTPTSLRQKVAVFFKDKYPESQNSEKFVNTMLVGLMGRLVEMRLVEIEKDAQKSKYSVTNIGEQLSRGTKI